MLYEGFLGLTDREFKVMDILQDTDKDLTVEKISNHFASFSLSPTYVAQVIPRLLKKDLIHIENFVLVTTRYARTFLPNISRYEYMAKTMPAYLEKMDIQFILQVLVSHTSPEKKRHLFNR